MLFSRRSLIGDVPWHAATPQPHRPSNLLCRGATTSLLRQQWHLTGSCYFPSGLRPSLVAGAGSQVPPSSSSPATGRSAVQQKLDQQNIRSVESVKSSQPSQQPSAQSNSRWPFSWGAQQEDEYETEYVTEYYTEEEAVDGASTAAPAPTRTAIASSASAVPAAATAAALRATASATQSTGTAAAATTTHDSAPAAAHDSIPKQAAGAVIPEASVDADAAHVSVHHALHGACSACAC
jgi:hypothetical protein